VLIAKSGLRRTISLITVAAVTAGGLTAASVQHSAPAAATTPPVTVTSLPDLVSARIAAAAQGSRVEVTSLDTESSTTWVNPDGTFTTDINSGPVQAQDAHGDWQPLDDTLHQQANGTVAPDVSVTDVVFAKNGSSTAAKLGSDADSAAIKWDAARPVAGR
jgi:hypothetical protein